MCSIRRLALRSPTSFCCSNRRHIFKVVPVFFSQEYRSRCSSTKFSTPAGSPPTACRLSQNSSMNRFTVRGTALPDVRLSRLTAKITILFSEKAIFCQSKISDGSDADRPRPQPSLRHEGGRVRVPTHGGSSVGLKSQRAIAGGAGRQAAPDITPLPGHRQMGPVGSPTPTDRAPIIWAAVGVSRKEKKSLCNGSPVNKHEIQTGRVGGKNTLVSSDTNL